LESKSAKDISIRKFSKQFIGTLLSKPADRKANSFIYNEITPILTPIDNDL
jgi:hypothetical protein